MNEFAIAISDVDKKYSILLASTKYQMGDLPKDMPLAGIYLLSEDGKALYVGRSNKLRNRLQYHTRNTHNQATLHFSSPAKKLAKQKPRIRKPDPGRTC